VALDDQEIAPEDSAAMGGLAAGAQGTSGGGQTLADIIFSRMQGGAVTRGIEDEGKDVLHVRDLAQLTDADEVPPDPRRGLNPKVIEVYTK